MPLHLAIIKWFMCTKGIAGELKMENAIALTETDFAVIIENNFQLCEFEAQSQILLPELFKLNGPTNFILSQPNIVQFLHSAENDPMTMLHNTNQNICKPNSLGSVPIEYILNQHSRKHKIDKIYLYSHPFSVFLQDFCDNPTKLLTGSLAKLIGTAKELFPNRFSYALLRKELQNVLISSVMPNMRRLSPNAWATIASELKYTCQVWM